VTNVQHWTLVIIMPTPFNDERRRAIRASLMASATEHFARHGLTQTPLVSLTDAAGISKSSFYAFFRSKEALYLELIAEDAPEIEARVLAPLRDTRRPFSDAIADALRALLSAYRTRPLLRRLLEHPAELAAVAARVTPEEAASKRRALAPLRSLLDEAVRLGRLAPDVDADTALAALQAVLLLELQRDRIGARHEAVVELIVASLAGRLAAQDAS
jgi:AcrR family transcriptional regulator